MKYWYQILICLMVLSACQNVQPIPQQLPIPPVSLEAQSDQAFIDHALKGQLIEQLNILSPVPLAEKQAVSDIALEHAQQIAEDQKNTKFRTLAYEPVAPKPLVQRLLQTRIYSWDNLFNSFFSTQTQEEALERFSQQAKKSFQATPFTHYGLGVVKKGKQWFVSLVLITEIVQLKGLDIVLTQGEIRKISGQIVSSGYTKPSALVTRPDGEVVEPDIQVKGNSFQLNFPFEQKGYYSFEINVEGVLGPQPATNFVVSVGVPALNFSDNNIKDAPKINDLTKARNTLLELVNQDRKSLGLSLIELDSTLNLSAQSHSKDMVDNHYVGHSSPTKGTVQEQVAEFGTNDIVAQNIAVSRSLENSQKELMSSPGHRKTIINPENTHVGFGISRSDDGFLYITQNFARKKAILDPLPVDVEKGTVLKVSGQVLNHEGLIAVFINKAIVGDPISVVNSDTFSVPVKIPTNGKSAKIQLGFSQNELTDEKLTFDFSHSWEIQLK